MFLEIFKNGKSTGIGIPASNKTMIKGIIDFNAKQAQHYEQKTPVLRGYILESGVRMLTGYWTEEQERALRWKCARPLKEFLEIN